MAEKQKPNLTLEDIDRIIREVAYNPKLSKAIINKKAGITPPGSREDKLLKPWIQGNTYLVFGEKIDWQSVSLTSMRDAPITPDLVGTDFQGHPVIIEVKFKFDFPGDTNHLRSDPEHKSIGQTLQYALAYKRIYPSVVIPRLFIVSIDFSPDVEDICQFLCSKDIDIKHIAIERILSN